MKLATDLESNGWLRGGKGQKPPACTYCDQDIEPNEPFWWMPSRTRAVHEECAAATRPSRNSPTTPE